MDGSLLLIIIIIPGREAGAAVVVVVVPGWPAGDAAVAVDILRKSWLAKRKSVIARDRPIGREKDVKRS